MDISHESWTIVNLLPEPMLLVTMTGNIVKANRAAQRLFPLISDESGGDLSLSALTPLELPNLTRWLRLWARSSSMVSASLPIKEADEKYSKIALEATGIHQLGQETLILLRFIPEKSMLSKFVTLTEQVTQLNQEIAKQKIATSQLHLQYRQLITKNRRLESLAFYDGLTGVANRRTFDEALQRYWLEALQENVCLGIILLDVDYFKLYNDTYGHIKGDACLKQIAKAIGSQIREEKDLVARYGGEEFVVLLKGGEESATINVTNRILEAVRNLAIPHETSPVNSVVTLSAGVHTLYPQILQQPSDILVKTADQALYQAKREGRDRFMLYTSHLHQENESSHYSQAKSKKSVNTC